jgi:putative ABC transport system permease protein
MAGLSIAIGVALAIAIHTVNRSALSEFNRALDMVNGQASAQVIAPWGQFDDPLFDRIYQQRHALGIETLSPVLEIRTDQITIIGLDLFLAAQVTPALMPLVESGARDDLFAADALFLSPQAMRELNLIVGERIRLKLGFDELDLRVVGTVPGAIGQSLAVMDLGLAQWRFNQLGKISRIDLKLHQHHDVADISQRLKALEPNLQLITPSLREQRLSNMSRAYRVNLAVLALVALLTGAFLIFVAVGFSVIAQQSQLTLLRTLGASRRWLMSLIVIQGGGVALIGGLFGVFAGYGLAPSF